jgi:hypothetical protein
VLRSPLVNFFGHAVVASWQSGDAGFVLGSMLPDFATMIGARVPGVAHPGLEAGLAFHHATDHAFHDAPTFRELQASARGALRALGLPRPSALAVGHIGVEILLDSALASDASGVAGYLAALGAGHRGALGVHIDWGGEPHAHRYEGLRAILLDRGVTSDSGDPRAAAFRIVRALSGRPRLRVDEAGERIVRAWAEEARPVVAAAASQLVAEVLSGIPGAIGAPQEPAFG